MQGCRYLVLTILAAVPALPSPVFGQAYPAKSIRIVLPFAAGSAVDALARFYGQKMSETWKQQVVVDNRTGASGIIGTEIAARAPADGYTLYMGNVATLAINPNLYPKLPFDVVRDFAPISLVAAINSCLIVHPSLPVKNVKELVALRESASRAVELRLRRRRQRAAHPDGNAEIHDRHRHRARRLQGPHARLQRRGRRAGADDDSRGRDRAAAAPGGPAAHHRDDGRPAHRRHARHPDRRGIGRAGLRMGFVDRVSRARRHAAAGRSRGSTPRWCASRGCPKRTRSCPASNG